MPDISLRFKIILLFCLLGLLPQIVISYVSVDAYTESLEEINESKVSQLVNQVAEQTAARTGYLLDDLEHQASQPYLQLSFQQYPQQTRLQLLKERLELYRSSGEVFSRLHLCYLNGERLIGVGSSRAQRHYSEFEKGVIVGNRTQGQKPFHKFYATGEELALFFPVKSFRESSRVVGVLVAYLPVTILSEALERIDFGEQTEKIILSDEGEEVKKLVKGEEIDQTSPILTYSSMLKPLDWTITVRISENELFQDVVTLKTTITFFIIISLILAFTAWFVFSYRFTRPFNTIMQGSEVFATGDLDHRIYVSSGYEAKQLATSFNDMASQLKERQEELNQSARLASLGVMTAGLAHEIKNPLAGIKTSTQVIGRMLDPDLLTADNNGSVQFSEEDCQLFQELTEGVSQETDRLTKLLNDMLEFGKPSKPEPVVFDLKDVITRALSLEKPECQKRNVSLINNVQSVFIKADSDQILQVVLNLLKNSLQSVSDDTGQIDLLSEELDNKKIVLKIKDNGKGIPEDQLQRVFDPFFSRSDGGTGLGLSVVYTLLKQNDAHLDVSSTFGEGSEFTIRFPGISE